MRAAWVGCSNSGGVRAIRRQRLDAGWPDKRMHGGSDRHPALAFAERNLKKDDLVIVEGRLENRSYQKEGQTHHVTEIAVREGRGDLELMAKAG